MKITRDRSRRLLWLDQASHIERMAERHGLLLRLPHQARQHQRKPSRDTQAVPRQLKSKNINARRALSCTQPSTHVPDVSHTASRLSQYLTNPSQLHQQALNRCIQYLYATRRLGLVFDGNWDGPGIEVYTDASFAEPRRRPQVLPGIRVSSSSALQFPGKPGSKPQSPPPLQKQSFWH